MSVGCLLIPPVGDDLLVSEQSIRGGLGLFRPSRRLQRSILHLLLLRRPVQVRQARLSRQEKYIFVSHRPGLLNSCSRLQEMQYYTYTYTDNINWAILSGASITALRCFCKASIDLQDEPYVFAHSLARVYLSYLWANWALVRLIQTVISRYTRENKHFNLLHHCLKKINKI